MRCFAVEAVAMFATGVLAGICLDRIILSKQNPPVTANEDSVVKSQRSIELVDGKVIFNLKKKKR